MKLRAESAEVFYPDEKPVLGGASDIETLKRAALASPRKRARICTHGGPADQLHEMLIVLHRESYVRPHKHLGKVESCTILEGEADVVLFHDDGTVRQIFRMGPLQSGETFYYRLSQPIFHTVVARSEYLVFHEVTEGPFCREHTVFAVWSPEVADPNGVSAYLRGIRD